MERFGRYVLLEKIAAGGMAEVFRGVLLGEAGFAQQVAIKKILPQLSADAAAVRALVEEAKVAAELFHPNIVRILDLGKEGDDYFIAMELVAGQSVAKALITSHRKGLRLPLPFILHVVGQALEGLSYAHQKRDALGRPMGIVHRDVSPQNLMCTYDGRCMLLDFGIAKAAHRAAMTRVGTLKGKPGYLSPEVVRGEPVTQALDLYAVGVVMHELIAMRRMRSGTNDILLLREASTGQFRRFDELNLEVPDCVSDVVYRALDPDPTARFETAAAFAAAASDAARQLNEPFGTNELAAFMAGLFVDEIAGEEQARLRVHKALEELAAAPPPKPAPPAATPAPAPPVEEPEPVPAPVAAALFEPDNTVIVERGPRTARLVAMAAALGTIAVTAGYLLMPGAPKQPVMVAPPTPPPLPPPLVEPVDAHVALPAPASVLVESKPPGASVSLDGEDQGITPLTVTIPPGGEHSLRLSLEGHGAVEQSIAAEFAPPRIVVDLGKREPPPPQRPLPRPSPSHTKAQPGRLTVQSKPWARVHIDGKDTGKFTPLMDVSVKSGRHRITLVNDELGVRMSFDVDVKPGASVVVTKSLK